MTIQELLKQAFEAGRNNAKTEISSLQAGYDYSESFDEWLEENSDQIQEYKNELYDYAKMLVNSDQLYSLKE